MSKDINIGDWYVVQFKQESSYRWSSYEKPKAGSTRIARCDGVKVKGIGYPFTYYEGKLLVERKASISAQMVLKAADDPLPVKGSPEWIEWIEAEKAAALAKDNQEAYQGRLEKIRGLLNVAFGEGSTLSYNANMQFSAQKVELLTQYYQMVQLEIVRQTNGLTFEEAIAILSTPTKENN